VVGVIGIDEVGVGVRERRGLFELEHLGGFDSCFEVAC
jgi:hypothetical protein